jgi:hypothetical protein
VALTPQLNAYCLNFNGRVTEASVKNFQLVSDENHNHVILQFGKVCAGAREGRDAQQRLALPMRN